MRLRYQQYVIEEINRIVDIKSMKKEWEDLVPPSIYYMTHTFEWFFSTWKSQTGFNTVRAITIRKGDQLISVIYMILPGNIKEGEAINIYIPTSLTPFYARIDHDQIFNCLIYYLKNRIPNWKQIKFDELDFSFSETRLFISSIKRTSYELKLGNKIETPILKWNTSLEEYDKKHGKSIKKELRNKERDLKEVGEYKFCLYTSIEDIQIAMDHVFEVDCMSWKYNDRSDMASRPGQYVFYETLATRLAIKSNIALALLVLEPTKEPIAFEYIVKYGNEMIIPKHSYKEKYSKYSPGVILRKELFREMLQTGVQVIDTWSVRDRFKMIWCNNLADRYTITVINDLRIDMKDDVT